MTIVQLEYIIALDTYRNFSKAAKNCFITQPTLSMQIKKLEEELGVDIFDRSKQPVLPTETGAEIIEQARLIVKEAEKLKQIISEKKLVVSGLLRIGVIPTIAPYLLPLFLPAFVKKYPQVQVNIEELTTREIIFKLKNDQLDLGLLVTPLKDSSIKEIPLFYESFVLYLSNGHSLMKKDTIRQEDIASEDIWLLNEGHCMRSQVMRLCGEKFKEENPGNMNYKTGSIETLKKMVEMHSGLTLLPELATKDMPLDKLYYVRYFESPEPVREVSLVTHRNFIKKRLTDIFMNEILQVIPEKMKIKGERPVVEIN